MYISHQLYHLKVPHNHETRLLSLNIEHFPGQAQAIISVLTLCGYINSVKMIHKHQTLPDSHRSVSCVKKTSHRLPKTKHNHKGTHYSSIEQNWQVIDRGVAYTPFCQKHLNCSHHSTTLYFSQILCYYAQTVNGRGIILRTWCMLPFKY